MPVVKMLAKIGRANVKYMVEFQADARVVFGKCIHFSKERYRLG